MKKRPVDVLVGALLYAVCMPLACLVIMFAEILLVKIANLFVVVDYFSLCVIRAVVYTLGVNALLGLLAFREGYKSARATPFSLAISAILASASHFMFALLFSFEAFAAGGVRSIAILIKFGKSINGEFFNGRLDRIDIIPYFLINSAIYVAVMIVANMVGATLRRREREDMGVQSAQPEEQ